MTKSQGEGAVTSERQHFWAFECETCGRGVAYPEPPAGPWRPTCGYHAQSQPMRVVYKSSESSVPLQEYEAVKAERDDLKAGINIGGFSLEWWESEVERLRSWLEQTEGSRIHALNLANKRGCDLAQTQHSLKAMREALEELDGPPSDYINHRPACLISPGHPCSCGGERFAGALDRLGEGE